MDIELDQYTVTERDAGYRDGPAGRSSRGWSPPDRSRRARHRRCSTAESGEYLYEVDVTGGCPTCARQTGGNICEECGEPNTCTDLDRAALQLRRGPPRRGDAPPATRCRCTSSPRSCRAPPARAASRRGCASWPIGSSAARRFDVPVTHPSSGASRRVEQARRRPGHLGVARDGLRLPVRHRVARPPPRRQWQAAEPERGLEDRPLLRLRQQLLPRRPATRCCTGWRFPDWEPDIDYHVNEFYLLEGSKFSTSRRHAIWGKEILTPETVDAVRFFLAPAPAPRAGAPTSSAAAYEACRRRDADRHLAAMADTTSVRGSSGTTGDVPRTPASGRRSTPRSCAGLGTRLAAVTAAWRRTASR